MSLGLVFGVALHNYPIGIILGLAPAERDNEALPPKRPPASNLGRRSSQVKERA